MKARIVRDIQLPDRLTLQEIYNWHLANNVPVLCKAGKWYYRMYEVEYDPKEVEL